MRIAGIDVSGDEVRIVVLDHAAWRRRYVGQARAVLPAAADPAARGRAVRDLLLSRGFGGAAAVVGMGSASAVTRRVEFPFSSPGKIARVLRLELESLMPGSLADQAVSCLAAGAGAGDSAAGRGFFGLTRGAARHARHAFLAAAVHKAEVERLRDGLSALDPEVLDLDLTGLWRTAQSLAEALESPRPAAGRVGGLRDLLTRAAAGTWSFPLLAVDVEPRRALLVLGISGQPRRARHVPLDGLTPGGEDWHAELRRQILMTLAAESFLDPARLVLTGSLADAELAARMIRDLSFGPDVPGLCREVRPATDLGRLLFPGQEAARELTPDMAVACGLALRGIGSQGLNFLDDDPSGASLVREAFGLTGHPGHARRAVLLGLGLVLAVSAYAADASLDIRFKKAWLSRLEGELTGLVERAAPGTRKGMEPTQYVSVLRDRLREMEAAWPARLRSGVGGGLTQLLRTVSRAIPEGSPVVVGEFTVDGRRVRMTATADAYETVETVRSKLLESGGFEAVEIKGATTKPGGGGVEFEMEMTAAGGEGGT